MPKKMTVKHKSKSVEVRVPEVTSIKRAVDVLGERRVLALLNMAIVRSYRDEARRRIKRGDVLADIPGALTDWQPPGDLPPMPSERLLEEYKKLPTEQQELFLEYAQNSRHE